MTDKTLGETRRGVLVQQDLIDRLDAYRDWVEAESGFRPNRTQSVTGLIVLGLGRVPKKYFPETEVADD